MAETFNLEVATPERLVIREAATEAQIPAKNGYIGVLPGHAPLLSELGVGYASYVSEGRKFYFALHSYEAYDLATMARKDALLSQTFFIPFALTAALAFVAILFRVRGIAPYVIFACAVGVTLVLFYVTARQRNALLPAVAILAAAG